MYQGRPSAREGLLYGLNFAEYDCLPHEIVRRANYTDTADTGDDYLCSLSYAVDADGVIYITDAVYSREPMEATEPLVGEMLVRSDTRQAAIESNNGGRGFARAVQAHAPGVRVEWFHQSGNKEARILSNSATALHLVRFPRGLEPPLARAVRPSDDLPPEVSRQPLARRGGRRDGHRRARNGGPARTAAGSGSSECGNGISRPGIRFRCRAVEPERTACPASFRRPFGDRRGLPCLPRAGNPEETRSRM